MQAGGRRSWSAGMEAGYRANKRWLHDRLAALVEARPDAIGARLAEIYDPSAEWRGAHPLNEMRGLKAVEDRVWGPLIRSFPDLERRDLIVVGGSYEQREYVAMLGHYCGTFRDDWVTIPRTGRPI